MGTQRHFSPWLERASGTVTVPLRRRRMRRPARTSFVTPEEDPYWYKDALIYEVHVRAFQDSDADGVGDFRGLTQRLDYLQDLGVTAIWLLPFYPSPLKDDGYDIADYYSINPLYGTLKHFKVFLKEAHAHGLRVITELVVNHTSDQHPWFQRSRRAPAGDPFRDFYVWSDSPEKYRDARIIFRDFEPSNWSWDRAAQAYYWHRFYAHQPDLNFDNPAVHRELARVLDFWLDLGVDGLRLDAVPYLYEREGTSCENLPETHNYLKTLRAHVDAKYGDRMLLAEANQWPEDAVTYFGSGKGDECHMAFHFPLMPRIFMAVRMEDRVPIVDILEQTPPIPETSQWALFLRNHDELTLEMVTDEERDYMYRVYANDAKARINFGIRRRLAPLLGNDRRRIELLNLLLFSLPGTPVLYYGDEIGMGDNVFLGDRNGVRTPMQWSSDKNAGFSRASPHALYCPIILDPEYHYEAINVEAQQRNPNSLLWWMRRTLTLRKRHQAFGRGSLKFLHPDNRKVLAFVRQFGSETILIVANLSRFPQPVQLDTAEFQGCIPIDLFGRAPFPAITDKPYFFTLAPHAAFWYALQPPETQQETSVEIRRTSAVSAPHQWEQIFEPYWREGLENNLLIFVQDRRWFGGKGRQIKSVQIRDAISVPVDSTRGSLLMLSAEYMEGDPEEYLLPVRFAGGTAAAEIERRSPEQIVAQVKVQEDDVEGVLYAAARTPEFSRALLDAIGRRRALPGRDGELRASTLPGWTNGNSNGSLEPAFRKDEQSNTSVIFGSKYFLKLFRRLETGTNPDLEIGRFLTTQGFANIPPVAGALEYTRHTGETITLGILTRFLPEAQDAWAYTLDMLSRYFDRVRTTPPESPAAAQTGNASLLELSDKEPVESVVALVGTFAELSRLLGRRTAELHLALAADSNSRDFAPEPFTPFYQRALFQSMRNLAVQTLQMLRQQLPGIPAPARSSAEQLLGLQTELMTRLRAVYETRMAAKRIRCHGDFHLGQVLFTGKDFVFIDFEGEPARPLGERRIKRSPLRDVAAMIRSFDYIAHMALAREVDLGTIKEADLPTLEPAAAVWYQWVSAGFLKAYLRVMQESDLLPEDRRELAVLLDAHLFEKAIYEIGYELKNRPEWVSVPLRGVLNLLLTTNAK